MNNNVQSTFKNGDTDKNISDYKDTPHYHYGNEEFYITILDFKSEQSVISSLNHVATIAICRRGALLLSFSVGD